MSVDTQKAAANAPKANGLATYFSVLFTPRQAFERLNQIPMWGWAALAGMVLTLAAIFLMLPQQLHLISVTQQQQLSQMPQAQQAAARQAMANFSGFTKFAVIFGGIIGPWIGWLVGAIVFLIVAALAGGQPKFGRAWVTSVNIYVVYGVAVVINAIIVAMRPPDTVNSYSDIFALPSLALIIHPNAKVTAFLYSYNVLFIWYYIVTAIAMEVMMKVSRSAAIIATIIFSLIWALIGFASAR